MRSDPVGLGDAKSCGDEMIETPLGRHLEQSFPTDASSALLFDVMDGQRAAQAYFWSLPLVAFASFRNEQVRVYEADRFGDFVLFDSALDAAGTIDACSPSPARPTAGAVAPPPGLIMAALGDRPAGQVTTREVEELLRTIAATGAAPRTVNKARQLVRAIFNHGMRPSTCALATNPRRRRQVRSRAR